MVIEQWGFFNVPHPLRHGPTVYNGHLRWPMTLTCWRAFDSGAVTTCFYDLGLSRSEIEPRSPSCEATALPLRHRGGNDIFFDKILKHLTHVTYFYRCYVWGILWCYWWTLCDVIEPPRWHLMRKLNISSLIEKYKCVQMIYVSLSCVNI